MKESNLHDGTFNRSWIIPRDLRGLVMLFEWSWCKSHTSSRRNLMPISDRVYPLTTAHVRPPHTEYCLISRHNVTSWFLSTFGTNNIYIYIYICQHTRPSSVARSFHTFNPKLRTSEYYNNKKKKKLEVMKYERRLRGKAQERKEWGRPGDAGADKEGKLKEENRVKMWEDTKETKN